jgi:hypothetical protein
MDVCLHSSTFQVLMKTRSSMLACQTCTSTDTLRPKHASVCLLANQGQLCVFVPSIIHRGGVCRDSAGGRISIAGTFRSAQESKKGRIAAWESDVGENAPLPPLERRDLQTLTVSDRLRYIAKAIMSYAHWYPGLSGLSCTRLHKGSARCNLDVSG